MTSEAGKIFTNREEIEPAVSNRLLGRLRQSVLAEETVEEQEVPFFRNRTFLWAAAAILALLAAWAIYWFAA
jgi:hypothetical protein